MSTNQGKLRALFCGSAWKVSDCGRAKRTGSQTPLQNPDKTEILQKKLPEMELLAGEVGPAPADPETSPRNLSFAEVGGQSRRVARSGN